MAPRKPAPPAPPSTWWGDLDVDVGVGACWHLGSLTVCLEHRQGEWRLASRRHEPTVPTEPALSVAPLAENSDALPPVTPWERRLNEAAEGRLEARPRMADRLLVSYLEGPTRIPAGGRTTLYVSTPLWLHLAIHDEDPFFDQPIVVPSESWLGGSTLSGELCYAVRVRPSVVLAELEISPYRAITRVRVKNRTDQPFELVRLALPAPNLTLYRDREQPEAGLWSTSVTLECGQEGEDVALTINRNPPRDLLAPELVAPARSPRARNFLSRALSVIVG